MRTRKIIFIAAAICLLICIGWMLREPTHCALCKASESDVPCLIDLHSGEVAELRISDYELSYPILNNGICTYCISNRETQSKKGV